MIARAVEDVASRLLAVAVALRSWRGYPEDYHAVQHLAAARLLTRSDRCGEYGCRADMMVDLLRPSPVDRSHTN